MKKIRSNDRQIKQQRNSSSGDSSYILTIEFLIIPGRVRSDRHNSKDTVLSVWDGRLRKLVTENIHRWIELYDG